MVQGLRERGRKEALLLPARSPLHAKRPPRLRSTIDPNDKKEPHGPRGHFGTRFASITRDPEELRPIARTLALARFP